MIFPAVIIFVFSTHGGFRISLIKLKSAYLIFPKEYFFASSNTFFLVSIIILLLKLVMGLMRYPNSTLFSGSIK